MHVCIAFCKNNKTIVNYSQKTLDKRFSFHYYNKIMKNHMIDHKKSILNSEDEVKLYAKEFLEPPPFLNVLFGRIDAVYQPRSTEKIREIFAFLHERNLGVLPRGAATYGMGGITPLKESCLVDLTHLDRIIGFDEGTHTVTCEGGTRWWNLKRYLNGFGYDLCTYPTSLFSTVGGWLSTGGD